MTKNPMPSKIPFFFFGTGAIARIVLEELGSAGLFPAFVITAPDAPAGRGKVLTPSPVAQWASGKDIEIQKPQKLEVAFASLLRGKAAAAGAEVFVVVDHGAILPRDILDIPLRGILNMHPSLLPRLRGPSPIRTAILNDERDTGVSVMLIDEKMDHGPLLAQKKVPVPEWPPRGKDLDALLAHEGGVLLAETLPRYLAGEVLPHEQDHAAATFSHFFTKEMGCIDLADEAYKNLLKIRAFDGWPGAYTFFERPSTGSGQAAKKIRVRITEAHIADEKLVLDRVIPEGKSEVPYADFARSLA